MGVMYELDAIAATVIRRHVLDRRASAASPAR